MKTNVLKTGFIFLVLLTMAYVAAYIGAKKVNHALAVASTKEMKEKLLELVPVGTPIGIAQSTMEKQGFQCSMVKNATFLEKDILQYPFRPGKLHPQSDYLFCQGTHPYTFWVGGAWYIDIAEHEGKVSNLFVANYQHGP